MTKKLTLKRDYQLFTKRGWVGVLDIDNEPVLCSMKNKKTIFRALEDKTESLVGFNNYKYPNDNISFSVASNYFRDPKEVSNIFVPPFQNQVNFFGVVAKILIGLFGVYSDNPSSVFLQYSINLNSTIKQFFDESYVEYEEMRSGQDVQLSLSKTSYHSLPDSYQDMYAMGIETSKEVANFIGKLCDDSGSFYSKDKETADFVQYVFSVAGYATVVSHDDNFKVFVCKTKKYTSVLVSRDFAHWETQEVGVICLIVDCGLDSDTSCVWARHNGLILAVELH
jgi:hypothetical protein